MKQTNPTSTELESALNDVVWNSDGLIPAIAQDAENGRVLMLAWMNRDALRETLIRGEVVYWSRSKQRLWHKGESSGHVQQLRRLEIDCDNDAILMQVTQIGGIACHTGRQSCWYKEYQGGKWHINAAPLKEPKDIYG